MIKKIKYLLLLSFIIILALCTKSQARITTNDPTVSSGGTVTITISSQEKVASGAIDVTSNGGLTFVKASGGQTNGTLIAFAGTEDKTSGIATYTFKAPTVTKTQTYKVVFSSKDMANADGELVNSSSATATVTVKGTGNGNSSNSNNTTNNTQEIKFSSVNETVYCTNDGVNVRSSYSTSSSVLGSLSKNESLKRTGVATKAVNGITWSKVKYNGQTAYVSSAYLTKTKPATTSTENKTTDDKKNDNTNKDDKKDENTKSSNKNLKSLVVTPSSISPKFSASTTEYAMTVGSDVDEIEIKAEAEDKKAEVLVEGNKNLKIGENTITIKVTAEDETVRTYKIAVTKEKKDQVGLKELLIEGVKLNPDFDANTYLYTVDMENKNLSELNITATANKEKATVEIIGNTNLTVGNNVITILVKESDTETATYQINVNITETVVAVPKNNSDLYKKIGMGVLGAVVLIAIVVTIVKMRKDNDDDEIDYKEEKKSSVKQQDLEEDELPKSLRKHKNEEQEERTEKDKERSRKIDELYSLDDNELAEKRRRGKHF